MDADRGLKVPEVAALKDVDNRTVYRWIREGHLKATRIGPRLIRVMPEDLADLDRPANGDRS
jgi:excisionase family DNA binding protein